jgi:DNA-directed RNA polymerase specialized sigma24 family protein
MVSYIRGRSRTLSDAVIVSRYLAGEDSTAIGADANCTADTVLYLVRRSGGTTRPRGPRSTKTLTMDDAEIIRLYTVDGLSGPTIADRAGTTPATVYARLRKAGVPRRPPGDVSKATAAAARARRPRREPA